MLVDIMNQLAEQNGWSKHICTKAKSWLWERHLVESSDLKRWYSNHKKDFDRFEYRNYGQGVKKVIGSLIKSEN